MIGMAKKAKEEIRLLRSINRKLGEIRDRDEGLMRLSWENTIYFVFLTVALIFIGAGAKPFFSVVFGFITAMSLAGAFLVIDRKGKLIKFLKRKFINKTHTSQDTKKRVQKRQRK